MQIVVSGTGPALVMIHGWAMHGGIFSTLLPLLQDHFTVHCVDLPGHGLSRDSTLPLQLDAVAQQIAERIPSAIWLGWSLGGLIALQGAHRFPQSVRGLIMLCASPCFVATADWPQGMDQAVFSSFARDLAHDYRATIDRFLLLEAQGSDHLRDDIRLLREHVFAHGEPSPEKLAEGLAILQQSDLRAVLESLHPPSLWLAGRRDRLVSPAAMQACAQRTPHGRYVEMANAGHAPFLTHAAAIIAAIVEFNESLTT